jgi:hypothetical protein
MNNAMAIGCGSVVVAACLIFAPSFGVLVGVAGALYVVDYYARRRRGPK